MENNNKRSVKCPFCGKEYHSEKPPKCTCGYYFDQNQYELDSKNQVITHQSQANTRENQEIQSALSKYYGVKGWLLFFCFSLIILGPGFVLYNIITAYEDIGPVIEEFPNVFVIVVIDTVLSLAMIVFSIYAGLMLYKIKPGAVKITKMYLKTYLVYIIISSILPFMAGFPSRVNELMLQEMIPGIIGSLAYFFIWYSFMNVSKRVKATYYS